MKAVIINMQNIQYVLKEVVINYNFLLQSVLPHAIKARQSNTKCEAIIKFIALFEVAFMGLKEAQSKMNLSKYVV